MNNYKNLELFDYCKKLKECFVVNEWEVHNNFNLIKNYLETACPQCMIVEATDAVHPFYDHYTDNLNFLINYFKNSPQGQLIYYSVNLYTEFDNIKNITYRWIPEYHAYYYPIFKHAKINTETITQKFLCLNKRVDDVRWMLYKKFYTDNLLDQSLFSFLGENQLFGEQGDINSVNYAEELCQQAAKVHPEIARLKIPPDMFRQLSNDQSLTRYKNVDCRTAEVDPSWAGHDNFYQETFCSIISETSASADKPNFSEKIFRTICYGHPFVLIASPNSLALLRDFGFDTYDDIFDNSYDTEPVRNRRIIKVFDVIDQIAKLSINDLNTLNQQLLPRRLNNIKNYQLMYEKMLNKSTMLVQELQRLVS